MIDLIEKYLVINHFASQKESFRDLFQSHPNYPSVFAITDTLDMLSIKNIAVKIPKEQLLELPNSFLAIFKEGLVLVTKLITEVVIYPEKGGKQYLSFVEFTEDWDGIIIVIEPHENITNWSLKNDSKWFIFSLQVIVLIILSTIYNNYGLNEIVLLTMSTIGFFLGVLIVQEKLGFKNQIVSKFCDMTPHSSCDSVIKSVKGKINNWLGFSDLPVLFFGINLISIILQPTKSSAIVGLLSLLSIPLIVYSIWIQKMELKRWCSLCLAISFLILLQSTLWIIMNESFFDLSVTSLFPYLFSMILITSFWLALRPNLENKIKAEKLLIDLQKFKRNYVFFNLLSKKIPFIIGLGKLEGLQFGNRNADVALTIILSPTCEHCHTSFQEAFELVTKYPEKVFLNVLFNINPENKDNPYKVVVERLLAIYYSDSVLAKEAIFDWHIKKIGLALWIKKWEVDTISMKVNHQIHQQYEWCLVNEFNYTPVKIVNSKLFPNEYSISELKFFLCDFSDEKELLEKSSLV